MNSEHKTNNEIRLLHEDKEFIVSPDILDPNGNPLIVEISLVDVNNAVLLQITNT